MRLTPMRFSGYTWHHNPKSLKIEFQQRIETTRPPYESSNSSNFGERLRVVRGEGELYGEDCMEQFYRLKKLYERAEPGILAIPDSVCMKAYFSRLKQLMEPKNNVLSYSFEFTQTKNENEKGQRMYYVTQSEGENLFDISYRFGVDIDTLVKKNPRVRVIDEIEEGERIELC